MTMATIKPLVIGGILGMMLFGVVHFAAVTDHSSIEFCTSCHEMSYNYEEYKKSQHYINRSGVKAVCADCHIPHDKDMASWANKLYNKVTVGLRHLYHHVLGDLDSRAKFDAKRWELANRVWDDMKANDSRECRHCHALENMHLSEQGLLAAKQHTKAKVKANGETCIDCHHGVAHKEPTDPAALLPKSGS
ncbi:MAG: NapC/NirT family cytochrome c [Magnetococcales bacterium]|nr:NapC/NirT family cytochrome c [Magnetococcales bacterium]